MGGRFCPYDSFDGELRRRGDTINEFPGFDGEALPAVCPDVP
jgi:hypothetical protein